MDLGLSDLPDILPLCYWLASRFAGFFPRWSREELVSELYVLYCERFDRWDSSRGDLSTFGLCTFRDPLMSRYLSDQGIRVRRTRGGPREYLPSCGYTEGSYFDPEPFDFPWGCLTLRECGLVQQRLRGSTITQIALSEGVAQSSMSVLFKNLRSRVGICLGLN